MHDHGGCRARCRGDRPAACRRALRQASSWQPYRRWRRTPRSQPPPITAAPPMPHASSGHRSPTTNGDGDFRPSPITGEPGSPRSTSALSLRAALAGGPDVSGHRPIATAQVKQRAVLLPCTRRRVNDGDQPQVIAVGLLRHTVPDVLGRPHVASAADEPTTR
jgi:hypothetical protein